MRSPIPITGRNSRLENLWQRISGYFRSVFQGSQRPLSTQNRAGDRFSAVARNYDLEIQEHAVRDATRATELIELCEWCPEVGTALNILVDDVFSSADGDDRSFVLSEETAQSTPDQSILLDPTVLQIGRDVIARCISHSTAQMIIERMLSYGDCFMETSLDLRAGMVTGLMVLPTWEMFRVEPQGELLGFQQRRSLWDEARQISFVPPKIVHWRYRRNNLYGRSLFYEARADWARLKEATWNLASAANDIGVNPVLHTMPEGASTDYRDDYAANHEDRLKDGVITHYYLMPGEALSKLSSSNPDLKALAETVLLWRSRIVMRSRVPAYLLGLPAVGAQDIAGQPALAYARFINAIRAAFTEGIVQLICTELELRRIDSSQYRGQLKITYPRIAVGVYEQAGTAADDESDETPDTEPTDTLLIRNGNHYSTRLN